MRYELRKAGMNLFIRSLTASELPKYLEHLLRLDPTDRRMRFGFAIGDTGIREHVQRIDLRTDQILALFDDDLDVVAAAHIVRARNDDLAEFAFSVDREWRSCGVGGDPGVCGIDFPAVLIIETRLAQMNKRSLATAGIKAEKRLTRRGCETQAAPTRPNPGTPDASACAGSSRSADRSTIVIPIPFTLANEGNCYA